MTLNMSGNSSTMDLLNSTSSLKQCSLSTQLIPYWTFTAFAVSNIVFILPLLVFVVFLGCQRWLKPSSSMLSHADVFTYNMVAMEMIQVLANVCFCITIFVDYTWLSMFTHSVTYIISSVKTEFQMLTCVELYLAVVFPIIYLRHKTSAGVTIRNISIGCVWLSCIVFAVLTFQSIDYDHALILYFLHLALLMFVICFCCISVLWTLKQHSPGDGTRDRKQADLTRLRAFYTILVIVTVLLVSLGGVLVCDTISDSLMQKEDYECFPVQCAELMSLPSSFVLPLLFLQRAGKLTCCKRVRATSEVKSWNSS